MQTKPELNSKLQKLDTQVNYNSAKTQVHWQLIFREHDVVFNILQGLNYAPYSRNMNLLNSGGFPFYSRSCSPQQSTFKNYNGVNNPGWAVVSANFPCYINKFVLFKCTLYWCLMFGRDLCDTEASNRIMASEIHRREKFAPIRAEKRRDVY